MVFWWSIFMVLVLLLSGKSLLWVAVLGLVVFYLYGIIGFALMRSMFDPADYLYCNTLWQCTITVIRYGLIGDLFEVSIHRLCLSLLQHLVSSDTASSAISSRSVYTVCLSVSVSTGTLCVTR